MSQLSDIDIAASPEYRSMVYDPAARRVGMSSTSAASASLYTGGTGTFPVADGITFTRAIDTLREPQTYTPVWLGNADYTNASANSIVIGDRSAAPAITVAADCVAIHPGGTGAVALSQGTASIAIGMNAGNTQGTGCVAVGSRAGEYIQGAQSVAVGPGAGQSGQGVANVAVGKGAGAMAQGDRGIAIGNGAGSSAQGSNSIAIGNAAGQNTQNTYSVAIGFGAGKNTQNTQSVAIGYAAGENTQNASSVAIGTTAGRYTQGGNCVAVGREAGYTGQGGNSVAVGVNAGAYMQGGGSVAIGVNAGQTDQTASCVAIGNVAGQHGQNTGSVAVGYAAGNTAQGWNCVAIGNSAGRYNQLQNSVAVGINSGMTGQGVASVAVGNIAGQYNQGTYSVALGSQAGVNSQAANSIVINATSAVLDNTVASSLVIAPVRNVNGPSTQRLYYTPTTKEITWGTDSSSRRYKQDIAMLPQRYIDAIHHLKPVEFSFRSSPGARTIGLIAEDVFEHIPEIVTRNAIDPGVIEGLDMDRLIAPLIALVQAQARMLADHDRKLATLVHGP